VAADARKEAEQAALRDFVDGLIERYVKVDRERVDSLDFHSAQPGFEAYLEDTRPIAQVEGGEPITVGELAQKVSRKLYHGTERAIEAKRLNKRKDEVLNEILSWRAVEREALRQGLDELPLYVERMQEFENGQLFAAFVNKVIDPDLAIEEQDLLDYLAAHGDLYASPEMVRLHDIVFASRDDAEAALARLRQGAEFRWLAENAPGRLASDEGATRFDGRVLVSDSLPEGTRKAIAGAVGGDGRIWAESENVYHVLWVRELIPREVPQLDAVRGEVARAVVTEARRQAVEEYAAKLRAASTIEIYAEGDALLEILNRAREQGM
jgi:hypothetical protein